MDTAMINIKDPQGRPAMCFFKTGSLEGEITVPLGDNLNLGHWDGVTYTQRLGIEGSGKILFGTNMSAYPSDSESNPHVQLHGLTQSDSGFGSFNWSAVSTSDARFSFARSKSGVVGTRGIVASGDELGTFAWSGDDGVVFIRAALIICEVDGTPGVSDMPGRIRFLVTPDGSATPAEALKISQDKRLTSSGAVVIKSRSITSSAGTTVLDNSDHFVVVTGATTHTLTLPACESGRQLLIKNRSSGTVTVNRAGADTIDGGTTFNLTASQGYPLVGNGTDWCRITV
jgi:hypothetical protein